MIELTKTVKKSGCAAKLPAGELRNALGKITQDLPKELLVGTNTMDDAALWDLGDGRCMIKTLDFFTPIVDDPYQFGAVAAANALSDVYAMGGDPKLALTILAFPTKTIPFEVLEPLFKGAVDKIQESGAVLGGGHSIDDDSLKLGFSVTGFVDRERAWTNAGAKVGDALILTKPLGTGTLVSAMKSGAAKSEWISAAIESMMTLNRAPELLTELQVNAGTDVTGFAVAGHAMQMAEASHVTFRIAMEKLPALPGAKEMIAEGHLNRAHKTNLDYTKERLSYINNDKNLQWLTLDPQTSGGLLLSVPEEQVSEVVSTLKERFPATTIIGEVIEQQETPVVFT